jgi:hypothetical protein
MRGARAHGEEQGRDGGEEEEESASSELFSDTTHDDFFRVMYKIVSSRRPRPVTTS